jgi:valyl-tRNA synthetase
MDKAYTPGSEEQIYKLWENSGAFTPTIDENKKPFTIILPPPNANDPLHAGHALFVVEDIMVRFHRMLGDPTLWLPGTDHAGIETQFVFEKKLQKEGKSRFDFDRETLFKMIFAYVNENRDVAKNQLKRLGFSLDWTREKFTLDEDHNQRIFAVFRKMVNENLIYRDEKIVNYCTFCGTAFSNLEINHKNVDSSLWYFKYPIVGEKDKFITVATTRPETMLGDTAVAVNPKDERYQNLKGKKLLLPLVNKEIPIIFDDSIDPKFGTGAVKVTPSHSPEDYDMGKTHNLEFIRIIDFNGKFNNNVPEKYRGFYSSQIREMVVKDLEALGLLEKTEKYSHEVGHCYKCGRPIEPLTSPQWFMKMKTLAQKAVEVVKNDKIKIFPKRFKKQYLNWMKDIRDWNISRQIVWGHRIPVWYCLDQNPNILINFIDKSGKTVSDYWKNIQDKFNFDEIKSGLQTLVVPADAKYFLSEDEAQKNGKFVLQETDTFDTWFSSGQWPYSTLGWSPDGNHSPDFKYFYPTTVLDTMWDILFFWVARMIMFGLYTTSEIPFEVVHLHSRVVDSKGQKMSKSKGNAINPLDIANNYGADALRMALVIGVAPGSDISLSDDKIRAQRNFVNKIWNASRFIQMKIDDFIKLNSETNQLFDLKKISLSEKGIKNKEDAEIIKKLNLIIKSTTKNIENYRFGQASEDLYQFFWKDFCDVYIETAKNMEEDVVPVLLEVLFTSLKLLHPFIPFVTETIYQNFLEKYPTIEGEKMLITSQWPK